MLGLTHVRQVYNLSMDELARKLGVSKQTVSKWESNKIPISSDRINQLKELFDLDEDYFTKELNDIDKLIIQKKKLWKELQPEIVGAELHLEIGDNADIEQRVIYDAEDINKIEIEIDKIKIMEEFKKIISEVNEVNELYIFQEINSLLKKDRRQIGIFQFTIDAVSHYYGVLPDWVGEPESLEFVQEFIELAQKYELNKNND